MKHRTRFDYGPSADARYQDLVPKLRAELYLHIREANPDSPDTMPLDEGIKGELPDEKIR